MSVTIERLAKNFGQGSVLDGIDLEVAEGEFMALLGPSGSGKTSLLRIIAGLEVASAGRLLIDGRDALALPPGERRIGFVFQNYALFRHMRVFDNIAFGLAVKRRRERPSPEAIASRVTELLDLVQLSGLERRFPAQLSGGQRQRVALARALAVEPRLLLLDEPFGALDAGVRVALREWLRSLHDQLGLTSIFVTHDQGEALALADRIAVLNAGRIEQIGTPAELYDQPVSAFTMAFLGPVNRLACTIQDGVVRLAGEALPVPDASLDGARPPDGPATAMVRPADIRICGSAEPAAARATLRGINVVGGRLHLRLARLGQGIDVEADRDRIDTSRLFPGAPVRLAFRRMRIFTRDPADAVTPSAAERPEAGEDAPIALTVRRQARLSLGGGDRSAM
ncbi:MAG TPA: ATP-binding cassette domain-containing protein [Stellaceae bacterium]|jgi:sulfate transport system ATP-binding protein|nr:ATP-binding cassette domain-containing protein [Stellaceae bacterium]